MRARDAATRSPARRPLAVVAFAAAPAALAALIGLATLATLAGCASLAGDGADRGTELGRLARSVMTSGGNVQVRYEDGVAFVFGNVESATDRIAILRALEAEPDVEDVRDVLTREM